MSQHGHSKRAWQELGEITRLETENAALRRQLAECGESRAAALQSVTGEIPQSVLEAAAAHVVAAKDRQQHLTKRFRKVAWGRLYWKNKNWRWRDTFDSDDVCVVQMDGGGAIHYQTRDALEEDIVDAEDLEKEKRKPQ